MTASANIKTPSMDLPVKPGKKSRKRAKQLQRKFTRVTLAQVSYIIYVLSMSLVFCEMYHCPDVISNTANPMSLPNIIY